VQQSRQTIGTGHAVPTCLSRTWRGVLHPRSSRADLRRLDDRDSVCFGCHGDQTSSWLVNKSLSFVNVNDNETGFNRWNEPGNSNSSWVGSAANDRADWFICYL
jgi:hypothetical protein